IECVCDYCGVDVVELAKKSRDNDLSTAKGLICYWGSETLGNAMRVIGERLNITQPGVSYWARWGRDYCNEEGVEIDDVSR
ncbi:MAG: hypothetical protein JXA04_12000, partial [Gammaproteobacteria bacterium]|nr:hypothetical protein [Gammaproteobacteria bacterium]